jgi:hypothetical protein
MTPFRYWEPFRSPEPSEPSERDLAHRALVAELDLSRHGAP